MTVNCSYTKAIHQFWTFTMYPTITSQKTHGIKCFPPSHWFVLINLTRAPQLYTNAPTRNQKLPNYSAIEIETFVALRPHTRLAAVALTSSPHLLSKMVMFGSMVVLVIKCYFTAALLHYFLNIWFSSQHNPYWKRHWPI